MGFTILGLKTGVDASGFLCVCVCGGGGGRGICYCSMNWASPPPPPIEGLPGLMKLSSGQVHHTCMQPFISLSLIRASKEVSSTVRAPVIGRHQFFGTSSEHYGKAHGRLLHVSGWMNYLHCMLLVSYIQQYFNTSITVLTNQVWKLLIALFKVPNTDVLLWYKTRICIMIESRRYQKL